MNRRLLVRTTVIFKKLVVFLNSDSRFKSIAKICQVSGRVPRDIDTMWYLNNVLYKNIQTVCGLPLIKTESGSRKRIVEVIIPEITKNFQGQSEFSDERI